MKKLFTSFAATAALLATISSVNVFAANPDNSKVASVKASVRSELSLSLSSNLIEFHLEDASLNQDTIVVTGSSNTAEGYTIFFNANTDHDWLKHSSRTANIVIPTLTEDAIAETFPETAWGYTTDETDKIFKGVSLLPKGIFETSAPGTNSYDFTVAVKARDDIPAGSYENTLLFTIVGKPETYNGSLRDIATMQEMTPGICYNSEVNESVQLKDVRDNKTYWVTKFEDGNCWMTQNLDYDLSVPENQTLVPTTSNVTETRKLSLDEWEIFDWDAESILDIDEGRINYLDGGDYYYIDGITKTAGYSSLPADDEKRHYHIGDYYSWRAATAGEGTTSIKEGVVKESICPAGWQLPNEYGNGSYYDLDDYYDFWYDPESFIAAPFYGTLSDAVYGGSIINYEAGYYWNNKAYYWGDNEYTPYYGASTEIYQNYFSGNTVFPRVTGVNVRCVAKNKTYIVILKDQDEKSLGNTIYDDDYMLPSRPNDSNRIFLGWAEDKNATEPEYEAEEYVEEKNITLYAIYRQKTMQDISTMQEMTPEICAASSVDEQTTLKDIRDNARYPIRKLADNSCWMTSNLMYSTDMDIPLTIADSDVTDDSLMNSSTFTRISYWSGWDVDSSESYSSGQGNFYNYDAATADRGEFRDRWVNEDIRESVCPKGWRLPHASTSSAGGDFESVKNAYGVEKLKDTPLNLSTYGGTLVSRNSYVPTTTAPSYYWTSTVASHDSSLRAGDDDRAYALANSSNESREEEVPMLYGAYIRCLAR